MKTTQQLFLYLYFVFFISCQNSHNELNKYVHPLMGTGGDGCIVPAASVPFGMVQLSVDTRTSQSGYHYTDNYICGISHTHKSGGGCTDFQDIMFFPICDSIDNNSNISTLNIGSEFSHNNEIAEPGYYKTKLKKHNIDIELTATERCGIQKYCYPKNKNQNVIIDLSYGNKDNCTIFPELNYDTVQLAKIRIIDSLTISGVRVSSGWTKKNHVYFYTKFSRPFISSKLYNNSEYINSKQLTGLDLKCILKFDNNNNKELTIYTALSSVSEESARDNLQKELNNNYDFNHIKNIAQNKWNKSLSKIIINDDNKLKDVFYSCLFHSLFYPMIYSDVNGYYRGPDHNVHHSNHTSLNGVLGLWDIYRAHLPLMSILYPDKCNDLINTFYNHYKISKKLPIWVLAGEETCSMIGYHSMPVIADFYYKGIRDWDVNKIYDAMKYSANVDTFGYYLGDYRGCINYKKYKYIPCDKEITSVSKTLEYSYDDWCIAQMAKMLGKRNDYKHYIERAKYYRNLFDKETNFMRGKNSQGNWRYPFDPFMSNHYRSGDDFCEGNSWQWTFNVPHDGEGLIKLFGGKETFVNKLDSLFKIKSEISGENPAPDITGLIGQYAHGNEPSHSTIYMYNYAGEPWKCQKMINYVLYNLYNTSSNGLCGNDDTGQMSAWFVFSAMGFYPMTLGNGIYFIGTPIFKDVELKHQNGTLRIIANNVSKKNLYIQSLKKNGVFYEKSWIKHEDLFNKDVTLEFTMGETPNYTWGTKILPPSICDEAFNN